MFQLLVGEINRSQSCLILLLNIIEYILLPRNWNRLISLKVQKHVNVHDHRNRERHQTIQFPSFHSVKTCDSGSKSRTYNYTSNHEQNFNNELVLQNLIHSLSYSSHNFGTDHPILRNQMQPLTVITWTNIVIYNFIIW